jgi:hypothetical protein
VRPRPDRLHPHEGESATRERHRPAIIGLENAVPDLEELRARHRPVGDRAPQRLDVHGEPIRPAALRLDVRRRVKGEVTLTHHVQRRAERPGLDDRAAPQRAGQVLLLEALHPRPQSDVGRRRVLRLQRDQPLDRTWQRETPALDQHLSEEQRAVQLTEGDRAHRPIVGGARGGSSYR